MHIYLQELDFKQLWKYPWAITANISPSIVKTGNLPYKS